MSDAGDGGRIGSPLARRAIVLVIDACGVGALPDAARYGDEGTNTLLHLAEAVGGLKLPDGRKHIVYRGPQAHRLRG